MQAVLDLPMAADITQQIVGGHLVRIEASNVVANVVRNHRAAFGAQLAINAQCDAAARQVQRFADIVGVV